MPSLGKLCETGGEREMKGNHVSPTNYNCTGLDTNWLEIFLGTCPPNLSLARLATDMGCLLWQSLNFKIVQIEAIAQGATVFNFLLLPPKIGCPGQSGNG